MTQKAKQTSLYAEHIRAGARMVPFAGWEMPVQYGGILDEVRAVRGGVGAFDVSHMGQVRVTGPRALEAVQRLFTNNAARLAPGQAQYSLMCRDDGGILDDVIVYRWDDGTGQLEYVVVVNASNRAKDVAWMVERGAEDGAAFEDISDEWALVALQGPRAAETLAGLKPDADVAGLASFAHAPATFSGLGGRLQARVSRTGYTGEDGFEVYVAWDDAPVLWTALMERGVTPCGLGARDVLRIEASYPLYGHEINEQTRPGEAGLGWVVKAKKGHFIGREAMLAARESGWTRRLRGILPDESRTVPRLDMPVRTDAGEGRVTSGTFSPTLNRAIGLAYVPLNAGESAVLAARGREVAARLVDLPFYKRPIK